MTTTITNGNGAIAAAFALGRTMGPEDDTTLRRGRDAIYRGVVLPEERTRLEAFLETGWDERPEQTRFFNALSLRVTEELHRRVLVRCEAHRRYLSSREQAPADPELDAAIRADTEGRAADAITVETLSRKAAEAHVQLLRAQRAEPKADHTGLRDKLHAAQEALDAAREAQEKRIVRLSRLLSRRAEARRLWALAESTKK
jgi:hypothetical protein